MKYKKLSLVELNALAAFHTTANSAVPTSLTAAITAKKDMKDTDPDNDDDEEDDTDEDGDGTKPKKSKKDVKPIEKASAFPNVLSVVPEGEHFTEEALNEGVWLTASHLQAIETTLATAQKANLGIVALQSGLTKTEQSLETANARIKVLETENATLKSEDGTATQNPTAVVQDRNINTDSLEDLATAETSWDKEIKARKQFLGAQ